MYCDDDDDDDDTAVDVYDNDDDDGIMTHYSTMVCLSIYESTA